MANQSTSRKASLADDISAQLASELASVETIMRETVICDVPILHEASRHLMDAGGGRNRPLLTLLAARFGRSVGEETLQAAAAVELLHQAALCHDDVLDKAVLRRGVESVNKRWDDSVAILAGDFLFSQAFLLLAGLTSRPARLEAETFSRLVLGEIREITGAAADADPFDHYVAVAADKTASLMRCCLRLGAFTSDADHVTVKALDEFGHQLGIAFQISDDLLDLVATEEELGKEPGIDLDNGVTTMPLLYAIRGTDSASSRIRELLDEAGAGGDLSANARDEAMELLRRHPALDLSHKRLTDHVDRARAAIDPLPEGPAKGGLLHLCDQVMTRAGTPGAKGGTSHERGMSNDAGDAVGAGAKAAVD